MPIACLPPFSPSSTLSPIKNELQHANPPIPVGNLDHVILKEPGKEYQYHFLSDKFDDSYERELYKEFQRWRRRQARRLPPEAAADQVLLYYAPDSGRQ